MTAAVGARNLFEIDAGVVHALMQARYQNSARGQFISEDPVFLGNPAQQNLNNPQNLNSYSYANDNPVVKKDPSGRCLEDGCVLEVAGTLGFVGGIATQAFSDAQTGDFSRRSIGDNLRTYTVAGTAGTIVAGGSVIAGFGAAAFGLSTGVTALTTGLTAGTLTAGTSIGGNALLGQSNDPSSIGVNSLIAAGTAGVLKGAPKVPGALPRSVVTALLSGAHAARSGAEELVSDSLLSLGQTGYRYVSSSGFGGSPWVGRSNGAGNGGGSSSALTGLYQSLVSKLTSIVGLLSSHH